MPERASLADVRRGEYEGLRDAVAAVNGCRTSVPTCSGAAGATAVGARVPLIAFNIYLEGTR